MSIGDDMSMKHWASAVESRLLQFYIIIFEIN